MSKRKSRKDKENIRKIATERAEQLIRLAKERLYEGNEVLAKRYCRLAKKLQLKYRVKLKKEMDLKYCKKCFIPWIFGKNVLVRNNCTMHCTEYRCECGYVKRYGYK